MQISIIRPYRFNNDLFFGELCAVCGQRVMDVVEKDGALTKPYLLSLVMNLVSTEAGAEAFSGAVDLENLVESSLRTSDAKLMKIINLVVRNSPTPASWLTDNNLVKISKQFPLMLADVFISLVTSLIFCLAKLISGQGSDILVLECLIGLTALLDRNLLTVETLSKHYKIDLELIERCQHHDAPEAMLALVIFMGAIASQKQGAKILHDVSMTNWLCEELSNVHADDEDLLLQVYLTN